MTATLHRRHGGPATGYALAVIRVGTSGWQYRHWRGAFYPEGLAASRWLGHYGSRFGTVEVNSTFYRLPAAETFGRWADAVPAGFVFAYKASRYLTHVRRLREPADAVATLMARAAALGPRQGPVLVQLDPRQRVDLARLDDTLAAFAAAAPAARVAVEPRHPSWFGDDLYTLLARHGAALCLVDRRNRRSPAVATADWGYVRLHEGTAAPPPCYGRHALAHWAETVCTLWGPGADVHVYFNNDGAACAPANASSFARACRRLGA